MINKKIKGNSNQKHYIEYVLPFFYVLGPYRIGLVSLQTILMFLLSIVLLNRNNWKILVPDYIKPTFIFIAFVCIKDVLRMTTGNEPVQTQINRLIEYLIMYVMVIIICTQIFDENRLYKAWKIAGLIYTIGILYHFVCIYFFQKSVSQILLIPGYNFGADSINLTSRPCSFFSEPAAYAIAMLPLEFLALKRSEYFTALLVTISVFISTSTVGIVLSFFLWVLFVLKRDMSTMKRIAVIFGAVILTLIFVNISIFENGFEKLLGVAHGEGTFKGRFLNGFEIVKSMSLKDLFWGTSFFSVNNYIENHISLFSIDSVTYIRYTHDVVFLNTITNIIFRYGIIGLFLFFYQFKSLYNRNYRAFRFLLIFLIASFVESYLLNTTYYTYLIILMLYAQNSADNMLMRNSEHK